VIGDHSTDHVLDRVQEALSVIRTYDPRRYARLRHQLQMIWVQLQVDGSLGSYDERIGACGLDLRYVVSAEVAPSDLASTIVHEATHARLNRFGYSEPMRGRIEAVCRKEERAFSERLPQMERDKIRKKLERWQGVKDDWWSDAVFRERYTEGIPETLRYMGVPGWFVPVIILARRVVVSIRRFARVIARFASGLTRA